MYQCPLPQPFYTLPTPIPSVNASDVGPVRATHCWREGLSLVAWATQGLLAASRTEQIEISVL